MNQIFYKPMDAIISRLSGVGSFMALMGIVSTILYFFDYNLQLLMWIDLWGETMGWIIRISLILIGALLYFKFKEAGGPVEEDDVE